MDTKLKKAERTEEVQEIIDRMPAGFGLKITAFVVAIVSLFFTMGWIIKYPDVVTGKIVINASNPPIKMVANVSGKIRLNDYRNFDQVREGSYIGLIQNPASLEDLVRIKLLLKSFNPSGAASFIELANFPRSVSLGELNIKYFTFLDAFNKLTNHRNANLFDKQQEALTKLIGEYQLVVDITSHRLAMSSENLELIRTFYSRDSVLASKEVLSKAENDKSHITLLSAKDAHQAMQRDISFSKNQLEQAQNKLQQNVIENDEKEKQLELALITSYTELEDNIKSWEQRFTFKAPLSGKVQFLKFWEDNQFVQVGEPVFTVIPIHNNIIGQMTLPTNGAGKVKAGQKVIIKLDNYPYNEYGSIKGTVSSISLTTNPVATETGSIDTYLVNVSLPDKLKTNYGTNLSFRYESKGTADIITTPRRLIQRLFDNLSYKFNQ